MKHNLWLILLVLPILFGCNALEEENEQLMVTKEAPLIWGPFSCNYYGTLGDYEGQGTKCKLSTTRGCKWPTKCKRRSQQFIDLAIQTIPGLTADTWGNEIAITGYDLQLMLWQADPYDHYHPDSIPPDTIQ